jgi:hypothetical protein
MWIMVEPVAEILFRIHQSLTQCYGCNTNSPAKCSIFPPVEDVIKLIMADRPAQGFSELKQVLLEAGLFTSEQILLLPEDVLSAISDIGRPQAKILCNYAKHIVLPLLGLLRNYKKPKIKLNPEVQNKRVRCSEKVENILECGNDSEVEEDEDSDNEQWEVIN